jgi:hypothetical protein
VAQAVEHLPSAQVLSSNSGTEKKKKRNTGFLKVDKEGRGRK